MQVYKIRVIRGRADATYWQRVTRQGALLVSVLSRTIVLHMKSQCLNMV